MLRPSILGAALAWAAVQPAYAQEQTSTIDDLSALRSEHGQPKSDITLSGNAAFLTQYAKRGFALSAERPAAQVEFDLFYKEIYYAGIFASNVNFGSGPNGQDLASVELDYYVGFAPTVGKWSFNFAVTYDTYPGAFDPGGDFSYVEIWTGVSRSFFDDKFKLTLFNYWSPEFFAETGPNETLELSAVWTFDKVWYFTPKLSGELGHQWGDLSQGGFDYTYWSAALTLGFHANPPLELEIRYVDSFDLNGFTCPPSGAFACHNLIVGSLKATF
jgi:uncharacterized protein (TIGR02001 family)